MNQDLKPWLQKINKQAKRIRNQNLREQCKSHDQKKIAETGRALLERTGEMLNDPIQKDTALLNKPVKCYVCKEKYQTLDSFYHQLCPACARVNHQRRDQKVCLHERIAVVTGGRIKIGYELVLKLLRDGANVIATSRFPVDALERISKEKDFQCFKDRIHFYGLDLRHLPSVEAFISYIKSHYTHIDILINNAAQTIKRPENFYEELCAKEKNYTLNHTREENNFIVCKNDMPGDGEWVDQGLFPDNQVDRFLQPIDQRPINSWVEKMASVSKLEFVEAQVINYFSPFWLASNLKSHLMASPNADRYIVNVSAMEGQFSRKSKTAFHPHTNMAKAALNMMTRTSASDYAEDGIYMNSVDTGWITQENPYPKAKNMEAKGFVPPLDEIDGAARIYDPIVQGVQGNPVFGHFLKDCQPYAW